MKSLADLRAIKEKALKNMQSRESGQARFRIVVGMGTCGIAAGARDVLRAIMDEIQKRDLINDVVVTQSGCAGFCTNEPMIVVHDAKGNQVTYELVDPEKICRIFDDHIGRNVVVSEYVFNIQTKG